MIDRIYLVIRNRNEVIVGMAKNKKDAKAIKNEEDLRIAQEYGFSTAKQAINYHGPLTMAEKWEYDTQDKRYYNKGEVFL